MIRMKLLLVVMAVLLALPSGAQRLQSGLLVGSGLGFLHNREYRASNFPIFQEGEYRIGYKYNYEFGVSLGYRFRLENKENEHLFYDLDLLLDAKVFESKKLYYQVNSDKQDYFPSSVTAHDANLALSFSPSINYKIVKGFYAGMGIEPTWYVVPTNEGKKFDIPLVWKVGYNINNKIDFSLRYRFGFTNTIDREVYKKGHISDLSLLIFIPFTVSR